MIQFNATRPEIELIVQIAQRAVDAADKAGVDYKMSDVILDIDACHSNGCPLELGELLDADATDFGHDVFGIRRHINRITGKLEDFFVPRFAKKGTPE